MKHEAPVYNSMHRVLATNYKTGKCTKTIGWRTPCSCGSIIETKQNSIKAHKAKVQKHTMEAKIMNTLPKFNEANKYVVTAVSPTGAVNMETFIEGDYISWDSKVMNDESNMKQHIARLINQQYPVVVTQTRLNKFNGSVDYQVVITIHPESITCGCSKGICCPLNKSQVNYWEGKIVTREMLAK